MWYRMLLILIVFFTILSTHAQDVDYNSADELISDIKMRKFEKPISFMRQYLISVENEMEVFHDTAYVGMTTLLASSYIQNNQIHDADTLLTHVINYMIQTGKKSRLSYSLFIAKAGLLCLLQNYVEAYAYLKPALDMVKEQEGRGENYSIVLSMLAVCHMNMNDLERAKNEIEESISIIEQCESRFFFSLGNKISIYQKAGAIFTELKNIEKAELYTKKAYDLSESNDIYISEYINAANNLAVIYSDTGRYAEALFILHQMEKKPLTKIERGNVYNNIFSINYDIDNEDETVKYANLCSNILKEISSELYASFPILTTENIWDKNAMQLKVNMGILDKFHSNPKAVEMCYDNSLFVKNLAYDDMSNIRKISQTDSVIGSLFYEIRHLKSERFAGNSNVYNLLEEKEKLLREALLTKEKNAYPIPTWRDIKKSLNHRECAIEFISYVGFPKTNPEMKEVKYAALILTPDCNSPIFVELCRFQQLHDVILKAYVEQEVGINGLYVQGKEHLIYNLIWEKIDNFVDGYKTIYVSPILNIQDINMNFITCPDGSYLNEKYDIRIVTSTAKICNQEIIHYSDAYVYGGIEYENNNHDSNQITYRDVIINELCDSTRNGFGFLNASRYEADQIAKVLQKNDIETNLIKGVRADETSFREMDGKSPSILHLATHGFYFVNYDKYADYFNKLLPYSIKDNSMLLSGVLLAYANSTLKGIDAQMPLIDGVLTSEEISMMDLRKTELVVLSACGTALGTNLQEGFGGLVKAFKNAGVKCIVASLWKVSDEVTANLMINFYRNLLSGDERHFALLKAQKELSKQFPDPYYWASFIMLD